MMPRIQQAFASFPSRNSPLTAPFSLGTLLLHIRRVHSVSLPKWWASRGLEGLLSAQMLVEMQPDQESFSTPAHLLQGPSPLPAPLCLRIVGFWKLSPGLFSTWPEVGFVGSRRWAFSDLGHSEATIRPHWNIRADSQAGHPGTSKQTLHLFRTQSKQACVT